MGNNFDWDIIAETLGVRLFKYFRRRGFEALASDLTQETLVRLYENVETGKFNSNLGDINQYAFGVARHVAYEHLFELNSHEDIEQHTLASNSPTLEDKMGDTHRSQRVRQAIGGLTPVQQEVLSLILDEELQLNEISKILNMPVGTVKSHVSRAKDRLKSELENLWEQL